MGLDLKVVDDVGVSGMVFIGYVNFNHFRRAIAAVEGFDLDSMVGYGGEVAWSIVDTPLEPLLNHSDCDGELTSEACKALWPEMMRVVRSDGWNTAWDNFAVKVMRLMIQSAESGNPILFE